MSYDLAADCAAIQRELVAVRRELHEHPELGFREYDTARRIAERLGELGLVPRREVGGTGVLADLETGIPGPTVLLRADMDALPIEEVSGRAYGSRTAGVMHACGHDAHMSALLGAAKILTTRQSLLRGRVRFLFQPAEELGLGAKAVIEAGALRDVDEAYGAHVLSHVPLGVCYVRSGASWVGADAFALRISGGGGHSGLPQTTRDVVLASAHVLVALQAIKAREMGLEEMMNLTVSAISGGEAVNVMATEVKLLGTVRWLRETTRERALARLDEVAAGVCGAFRVSHDLELVATMPVLCCAPGPAALLYESASRAGASVHDPGVLPLSEDFAHVAERVPAGFIGVGAGGEGCGAHHTAAFDIDERAITTVCETLAGVVMRRLER